jgi:putative transposase
LGLPVRLLVGPGQQNDSAKADELIDGLKAGAVLADKGYDSDQLCKKITEQGGEVVIPPRRHRKTPRLYDKHLYKERNAVERFFNKLKHFRRVATRYDKLLANFFGFVKIAAIALWVR